MLGGMVLAVGWMLCGRPVATDRCGFAGLLLAGGIGIGVLAALASATQLPAAAAERLHGRWAVRPALAEAVALLVSMVVWPLAGLAVGQVAAAVLDTSWQQPFTWWVCCSEHRAASWLALAVLWAWSLTPWAYALVAWQQGARWARWSAFSAVLLAVPFAVANSWSAVAEPLLREWRVPGWLLALPWLGMAGGCVVRAAMHGSAWLRGFAFAATLVGGGLVGVADHAEAPAPGLPPAGPQLSHIDSVTPDLRYVVGLGRLPSMAGEGLVPMRLDLEAGLVEPLGEPSSIWVYSPVFGPGGSIHSPGMRMLWQQGGPSVSSAILVVALATGENHVVRPPAGGSWGPGPELLDHAERDLRQHLDLRAPGWRGRFVGDTIEWTATDGSVELRSWPSAHGRVLGVAGHAVRTDAGLYVPRTNTLWADSGHYPSTVVGRWRLAKQDSHPGLWTKHRHGAESMLLPQLGRRSLLGLLDDEHVLFGPGDGATGLLLYDPEHERCDELGEAAALDDVRVVPTAPWSSWMSRDPAGVVWVEGTERHRWWRWGLDPATRRVRRFDQALRGQVLGFRAGDTVRVAWLGQILDVGLRDGSRRVVWPPANSSVPAAAPR
jgi:hypothetical protein